MSGERNRMNLVILLVVCTCAGAGLAVALALRKVASPKMAHPVTAEWIEELSVEQYRPMLRLLDRADHQFLRDQRDFEVRNLDEFRRERIGIFREYLKRLNADFASVCMALKIVMLQSETDRPDLATTLLQAQVRFAAGMVVVQARLVLYEIGIGDVEIGGLLSLFDSMRLQLRQMVPESAVWGS